MFVTLLSFAAAQTMAMPAPAICTAPGKLPSEATSWATPRSTAAATAQAGLASATLSIGAAARATLTPVPRVAYVIQPEHPAASSSRGGLFAFDVADAGTYRVALSGPVWIDVIHGGIAAASTAHGRGPDCTGIRKQVDFALTPGRYVLQVSGATDPMLTLLVARLPS